MIVQDDLNRTLIFLKQPKRIVSLCPSITETLCDLGLSKNIVGITDYCIYPKQIVKNIEKVGGIYNVSVKKIKQLNPDIIFASKQENKKSTIEKLSKEFQCFIFSINTFSDALNMINKLGKIFNNETLSNELVNSIEEKFTKITKLKKSISYVYLVWKNPYMAASEGTYIDSLLSKLSFTNCVKESEKKYPEYDVIKESSDCDIIFLPSEPYKFRYKDKQELQKIFPDKIILLVKGEMFCWYGTHLLKTAKYFDDLIFSKFK